MNESLQKAVDTLLELQSFGFVVTIVLGKFVSIQVFEPERNEVLDYESAEDLVSAVSKLHKYQRVRGQGA